MHKLQFVLEHSKWAIDTAAIPTHSRMSYKTYMKPTGANYLIRKQMTRNDKIVPNLHH